MNSMTWYEGRVDGKNAAFSVAPDGTVVPCQSWLGGTALGNILTDDWPAIWDGEACRAIRAESAKMEHICQLQTGNRGKEGC